MGTTHIMNERNGARGSNLVLAVVLLGMAQDSVAQPEDVSERRVPGVGQLVHFDVGTCPSFISKRRPEQVEHL